MTDNTLPPENCICASFYTVKGKHKPDCPLYDNTLDKTFTILTLEEHINIAGQYFSKENFDKMLKIILAEFRERGVIL